MNTNRTGEKTNDVWITPRPLVALGGKFDLDPCCPAIMPWRTATRMIGLEPSPRGYPKVVAGNGLEVPWRGRVWLNFPFSLPLPWVEKMVGHGNGLMLGPAKSWDAQWGQLTLATARAVLFLDDRISFCYADGTQSSGTWSPYFIAAYGERNLAALRRIQATYPGVIMEKLR